MVIRPATAADHALIGRVFARASLSNEGDRENLLAHPELLEFDAAVLDNGGTRVAVAANGHAMAFYEAAGFIADGTVETTFGSATHMHLNVV
jgi:hypothetical protein